MKNSLTRTLTRISRSLIVAAMILGLVGNLKPVNADVAAGISEYFIPGSADQLRAILVNNDTGMTDSNLHFVITVPISTKNVRVYYDQWENGYGTGATGYDEVYTTTKGEVLTFESPTVPSNPRGTTLAACSGSTRPANGQDSSGNSLATSTSNCYDGRDRIYVEGGAVAVAVAFWPSTTGTVYANAWEIYPTKPYATAYTIPVGEDLYALNSTTYADMDNVYVMVQATVNGTVVSVNNPIGSDLTNVALNKGEVTQLYHIGAGTTVTANYPVQVQFLTGQQDAGYSSRSYTAVPSSLWDHEYYSPVPSSSGGNTDVYIYNPTGAALSVGWQDSSGSGTISVPAGATRSFQALAGHYVPTNSGLYLSASTNFWAIGSYDRGSAMRNWGYSLIPVNTLTSEYYVGWAPGSTNLTANGSPIFITPTQDGTHIYVDYYPSDGVADAVYTTNRLEVVKIRNTSTNDNTGTHVWASAPIAIMWGQDAAYSGAANPYIDAGYTILPLNAQWIDVVVGNQKDASPESISYRSGETVTFTIQSTSGFVLSSLDVEDVLPAGMSYVNNSAVVTRPNGSTFSANPSVSGQTLTWTNLLGTGMSSGETATITFQAVTNTDISADVLTNNAYSTGWYNTRSFTASSNADVTILRPNLTATKSNNTSNTIALGNSFEWAIQIANSGEGSALFTSGQTILTDTLPSGPLYGSPQITASAGIVGTPACTISSNVLACTASGGSVTIPNGATITVEFSVVPVAGGSLVNPTGGSCAVDPNNNNAEGTAGESDNACSNTVTVTGGSSCPVPRQTIASWATFGDQNATGGYAADSGSGALSLGSGLAGLDFTGGTIAVGNWPNTAAPTTDYIQLAASTLGYSDIQISYDYLRDNNNGPTSLNFYYSSDGSGFSQLSGTNTVATSWRTATRDFSAVPEIDNNTDALFKFVAYGTGGNITNRKLELDNISVTGCPIATPPAVTKAFTPASIASGATSTLRVSFTNPNGSQALSGLAISDTYPAGLVNATPAVTTNTCGGTFTATAGTGGFTLSGGSLTAGGSCYIETSVTAATAQTYNNTTSQVFTIESGLGGTASATLTVATPPILHLRKVVTNDNGGTALTTAWTLTATGTGGTPTNLSGTTPVDSGATFKPDTYTLAESGGPTGYTASQFSCVKNGGAAVTGNTITLANGDEATCTITNDDTAPALHLRNTVTNDNGGTALATAWTISATGALASPTNLSGTTPVDSSTGFKADTYTLAQTGGPAGYTAGSWSCVLTGTSTPVTVTGNQVAVGLGQDVTCTINNNDNPPSLTLLKTVTNDNGGSAAASAWTLTATGTGGTPTNLSGASGVASGATFKADTYTLGESGPSGYTGGSWSCVKNGGAAVSGNTITLANGDTATCTINNNDDVPSLTLTNSVTNDDGGTAAAGDWTLTATGPTTITGTTPVASGSGFSAGTYTLSQTGGPASGYTNGGWSCTGGTFVAPDQITIAAGQTVSCSIANNDVAPTLKLVKTVTNDDGGSSVSADWTLTASGASRGFSDAGNSTTFHTMTAAVAYTLSESSIAGYTAGSWSCDTGSLSGSVLTLALGQNATCTIHNDDNGAALTLVKTVVNDNGGTLTAASFPVFIGSTAAAWGTPIGLDAGSYTVSETSQAGYAAGTWGGDCAADGSVTLALGESKTCTITNNDIAPKLHLRATVTNNNGGSAAATDWTLTADGDNASPTNLSGSTPVDSGSDFKADTYALDQSGPAGYNAGSWSCVVTGTSTSVPVSSGEVALGLGDDVTCTIHFDDIAPTLTLVKTVTNNNGGTLVAADFPVFIDSVAASWGTPITLLAGAHSVSETSQTGYLAGDWGGDCASDGSITLAPGDAKTCTITNDDIAPGLTLTNSVTNNDGGTAVAADWTLTATGPTTITGTTPVASGSGFSAGTYTLAQTGGPASGYTNGGWSCTGGTFTAPNQITIAAGETVSCSIANNDVAPTLKLVKDVTNNNGGAKLPVDWTLTASGTSRGFSDAGNSTTFHTVMAGVAYTLSESSIAGYNPGSWSCDTGSLSGAELTLALGQNATCTINNNDIAPTLTLSVVVNNNNGGTALPDDFLPSVGGTVVTSGAGNDVLANTPYAIDETLVSGYEFVSITGDAKCPAVLAGTLTLDPGENISCTITNNDIAPKLHLRATVTNDGGGTAAATDWTLAATGTGTTPTNLSGSTPVDSGATFLSDTYTLGQSGGPAGYTPGSWSCVVTGTSTSVPVSSGEVALGLGDDVTCTINFNDIAPTLTLVKTVTNNNGGTLVAADFPVFIDSVASTWGLHTVTAGSHTVSETSQAGYTAGSWGGDCASDGSITLAPGDAKTCTITNDDDEPALHLRKIVTNDNGGTALASAWTLTATGTGTTSTDLSGSTPVDSGSGFKADTYTLAESGSATGYAAGNWSCVLTGTSTTVTVSSNQVSVGLGQDVTCTITNNDIAPSLTLDVTVVNDDGGTHTEPEWTLSWGSLSGLGTTGSPDVTSGATLQAGTHDLSYSGPSGYAASAWSCTVNGTPVADVTSLSLQPGDVASCAVTLDDIAPKLTVTKTVSNTHGGTLTASSFTPSIDATTVAWETQYSLTAGAHTVSETGQSGYQAGLWGGDCDIDGSITLGLGDVKECSITNYDIAPKLTLNVVVNNDHGGTALPDDFLPSVGGTVVTSGAANTVLSNTPYAIDETMVTGYEFVSISGDAKCPAVLAGTVTLAPGEDITCTITNADIAPRLTVVKTVSNDHGGTLGAGDFTMNVTGTNVSDESFAGSESGVTVTLDAGSYSVDEDAVSGYSQVSASADCSGSIAIGESKTCTIANADIAPQLTIVKHVVNDDGGSLGAGDFTMNVTGTNVSDESFAGSESGVTVTLDAGSYSVDEDAVSGYSQVSASADCSGSIAIGESKTCTITNDDQAGTLVVVKAITNDNGGSATADGFQFQVDGGSATAFEADGENSITVPAGTYSVTEVADTHYVASYDNCTGVVVANGESQTCTITNDDVAPSLTLKATVSNNYGGTAAATDWTLTAGGPTPLSGTTDVASDATFAAGNYTLGFNSGPAGYTDGGWSCTVNGTPVAYSSSLALSLADVAVCEINFTDVQPTLTLTKTVDNSSGRHSLTQDDFPAFITGTLTSPAAWDTPYGLNAGSYTASETSQNGYLAGTWGGDCAADGSVTLAIGDTKTCTITNTAEDPAIALDKQGSLDMTVVDLATMVNAGDAIDYTFSVDASASNVPLHNVYVSDAACDSTPVYASGDDGDNILQTSETWVFSCSHTITQAEIEAASFTNNATAYGTSPFDLEVSATDSVTTDFVAEYALRVEKTSTVTVVNAADIVIPYTITLFNGGNMPVSNIVVDDAKCNADLAYQSGDVNEDHILQVEEEWIYTCTYRVTQADIDLGLDISNKVIVMADRIDPQAEDTLDIPVAQGPAIELTKSGSLDMAVVAPNTLTNPGDTITYTFSVQNVGNVTLWADITVTDPMLPGLSCTIPVSDNTLFPSGFVPGASAECTATGNVYTLAVEDIDAGSVVNTATAATTYEDTPVTDDDEVTTETIPVREITLVKEASASTFISAGEVVTYTYTITNSGNLDLYPEYTVVDDKVAVVTCPDLPDTLVPGGSVVCSGDYTTTPEDVSAGSVVNNATAFANTTPDCTTGCVLVQDSAQATVGKTNPNVDDTSANAAVAFLPATGFAPNQETVLSGTPEAYASTELTISIPALNVTTSITGVPNHNGTYAIDWLGNEVGWLQGSAYPGSIGNSILTAHNYLANGRPGPFVDLKTLKWGDQVIVEQGGRSYIFEVRSVKRVRPEDLSSLGHKDYGYLTLITCLGYDNQSESYLYRTIVQAVLVDVK